MSDNIKDVAIRIADTLGAMVNDEQIAPPDVLLGCFQGSIAFWLGCVNDGMRADALNVLRQAVNEEIDSMARGIANGMVPA
jgi:predicted Zn-dependent protease with MMP-like domain